MGLMLVLTFAMLFLLMPGTVIAKEKIAIGLVEDVIPPHPDTGNPVSGLQVPYWESMLLMAAQAVDMTGLGFLGVDMVIDWERGPLLLELNARPGLQIQIANQMGLHRRLELIDNPPPDIFATPKARVAWAVDKFKVSGF
jgi:hypothetical protein